MKRRIVLLSLVYVVISALLLVSCGTQTTQTTTSPSTTTTTAPPTSTPLPPVKTTPTAEVPKYGGTLVDVLTADPTMFDSGARSGGTALGGTVYEGYLTMDWTRGPAGSGVTDLTTGANYVEDHLGAHAGRSLADAAGRRLEVPDTPGCPLAADKHRRRTAHEWPRDDRRRCCLQLEPA